MDLDEEQGRAMVVKAPEKHGFDTVRLDRIDAFLKERYLETGKLPNAQLLRFTKA